MTSILEGVGMIRVQDPRGSRLYLHGLNIFMQRGNSGKQGRFNYIGQITLSTLQLKRGAMPTHF